MPENPEVEDVPGEMDEQTQMEILDVTERRLKLQAKATALAIKVTNGRDWRMIRDEPYLEIGGSVKVARVFGVSLEIISGPERINHFDEIIPFVMFHTRVRAIHRGSGESFEDEGEATSKDPFYWRDKVPQPPENVDLGDVRKKSITNAYGRAIKGLLGLRTVTLDELKAAGITPGGRVEYAKGKKGGAKTDLSKITKKQAARFWGIAKTAKWEDDDIKALLFVLGLEHTTDIPKARYEEACEIVAGDPEVWRNRQQEGPPEPEEREEAE